MEQSSELAEPVMILSGLIGTTVRAFELRSLSDVSLSERRNGLGTIKFGREASPYANPWPGMRGYSRPVFELIEQPRSVHETIRAAQRKIA